MLAFVLAVVSVQRSDHLDSDEADYWVPGGAGIANREIRFPQRQISYALIIDRLMLHPPEVVRQQDTPSRGRLR